MADLFPLNPGDALSGSGQGASDSSAGQGQPPSNPWRSPHSPATESQSGPTVNSQSKPLSKPQQQAAKSQRLWQLGRQQRKNSHQMLVNFQDSATLASTPGHAEPHHHPKQSPFAPMTHAQASDLRRAASLRSSAKTSATPPRTRRSRRAAAQSRYRPINTSGQTQTGDRNVSQPNLSRRASRQRLSPPVLYGIRLLIVGVGLGVIAGTLLSTLDPAKYYSAASAVEEAQTTATLDADGFNVLPAYGTQAGAGLLPSLNLNRELSDLQQTLVPLISESESLGLQPSYLVLDLDQGTHVAWQPKRQVAAASMIKFPILVAFLEAFDAGKLSLTEELEITEALIAAEAGEMQFYDPGTTFDALYVAEEMIRISDNTATNLLIDRLGGAAALNERFKAWGLPQTQLNALLPDLEGTNQTSAQDLVTLMALISDGRILTLRSRDRLLDIMRLTETDQLLPQGLGTGAQIAHKTGNIGKVVGDVGLIDMPNGKRYLAAMIVERPHGDYAAETLIQDLSRLTYDYLNTLTVKPNQVDAVPDTLPLGTVEGNVANDGDAASLSPNIMGTQ